MTQKQFFPKQSSLDHIKFTIGLNSQSVPWNEREQRALPRGLPKGQRRWKTWGFLFVCFKCVEPKLRLGFLILMQNRNGGSLPQCLVCKVGGWERRERRRLARWGWTRNASPLDYSLVQVIKPSHSSFSIFCHLNSWSRSLGQKAGYMWFFFFKALKWLVHLLYHWDSNRTFFSFS